MKNSLIIYGAGGLGREIYSLVKCLPDWEVIGFVDDEVPQGTEVKGMPVLGKVAVLNAYKSNVNVVIAIGNPAVKKTILARIDNPMIQYPVIIHPSVILLDKNSISIGEGSILTAGCVLTTDIKIGKHVLMNLNSTIGHDSFIGDYSSIMPGVNVAGEVIIEESVLIGSGANILNQTKVSQGSKVGMGAVVVREVTPFTTVVGVPARKIEKSFE